MKLLKFLPALLLFTMGSCCSVRVASDYDRNVDFTPYKTYAFYKNGIDKVDISDLDKKRILHAIDEVMASKGFSKSETPDLWVNFFTRTNDQVNVNQFGLGWGFGPFYYGNTGVYSTTEGTLFIDLIDAKNKDMIWQGQGIGNITGDPERKDAMIKEFVSQILSQYPPQRKK